MMFGLVELAVIALLGFLLLVGIGVAIVVAVVWSQSRRPGKGNTALEILNERYAQGEITREEYEEMRRDLGS